MFVKAAASSCEHLKVVVWAAVDSIILAFQFGRSELKFWSHFSVAGNKHHVCLRVREINSIMKMYI